VSLKRGYAHNKAGVPLDADKDSNNKNMERAEKRTGKQMTRKQNHAAQNVELMNLTPDEDGICGN
jgi:hypothetical protein